MRCVNSISLAVVTIVLTACCVPTFADDPEATTNVVAEDVSGDDDWRYTADGWQLKSEWIIHPKPRPPESAAASIHPLVIGTLELLISLAALLGLSDLRSNTQQHERRTRTRFARDSHQSEERHCASECLT